jgi:2,4-dienoyl-CoA reductase-like NADH-dependent reductase (Old Yellow Enzyme family)
MSIYFGKLFVDSGLAGHNLQNRLILASPARQMAEEDRTPNDESIACHARRARGGNGMVISERVSLHQPGRRSVIKPSCDL